MNVDIKDLLKAGAHFGHKKSFWSPKMAKYIYGTRSGVHIINLDTTKEFLEQAINFCRDLTTQSLGNKILFVGTKKISAKIIKEKASELGLPFISKRWLGGTLTNYKTIRESINKLKRLEKQQEEGFFNKLTKREVLTQTRHLAKLNLSIGGIKDMGGLPAALFVASSDHEHTAVVEAKKIGIPVIGIVDTNTNPEFIDFPIPANDDSLKTIKIIVEAIAQACGDGIQAAKANHLNNEQKQESE